MYLSGVAGGVVRHVPTVQHVHALKGQYHAIFSNTLKIEKTLFT